MSLSLGHRRVSPAVTRVAAAAGEQANGMVSAPTAPVWAADVLESGPPHGWTW